MNKEYISYIKSMTQLEGIELHGCICGVFAYDSKGYSLKEKQPKLFKSLLKLLININELNTHTKATKVANWLMQAKDYVGINNQHKFEFWISKTSIFENMLFEKPIDENAVIAYLGLKDTPITSPLTSLTREQIEARGLTKEECDSLRIIFKPWYRGTNSSKEWIPSNWAPCPLEEILCEKLAQFGEDPEENRSRFNKYNFAYEADVFELEESSQSGKEGNFIAKMPTEKEAVKIGHELADLVNGFNSEAIDFVNINKDIAEKSATYKWLPSDIQLSNWLHGIDNLTEVIDTLWQIAKSKELGDTSKISWYICKRYNDIINWEKGLESKIYLAFQEGLKGKEGPIVLKINEFIKFVKINNTITALAATESDITIFCFEENIKTVAEVADKPKNNIVKNNIVIGTTVTKKDNNETGVITDVDNTGFDVAFDDESFHYKMETYKKYLKVID